MSYLLRRIVNEKMAILKLVIVLAFNSYFIYYFLSNMSNKNVDFLFTNIIVVAYVVGIAYFINHYFSVKFIATSIIVCGLTYASQFYLLKALYLNHEKVGAEVFFPLREVGLYILAFVIASFFVIRRTVSDEWRSNDEDGQPPTILGLSIMSQFLVALSLISDLYIRVLKANRFWPILLEGKLEIGSITSYTLVTYFILSVVYLIGFWGIYQLLCRKLTLSLEILTSLFLATIFNYTIQRGITLRGNHLGTHLVSGATLFQILIIGLLFLLAYAVTNRYFYTTVLLATVGYIFSYANKEKYLLRSEPILLTDLKWIKELSFLSSYIKGSSMVIVFVLVALLVLLARLMETKVIQEKMIKSRLKHLSVAVLTIVTFSWINHSFSQNKNGVIPPKIPLLSSVHNVYDIDWQGITTKANFQSLGFVWMKQLTTKTIEEPKGYSRQKIEQLYDKYKARAEVINKERKSNISDRTVIYVLSESFSDPTRLPKVKANTNPIPEIKKVGEGTTSGLMKSDGYGGGTANMEFQSLIGLPKYHFDPTAAILFSDVFPKLKYRPVLSNFYDSKEVVHLYNPNGYNRRQVYEGLKFNKFISDKGQGGTEKPKYLDRLSAYYSDASSYKNILANIDPSKSQFFSLITMQNHGPWSINEKSIEISGEEFSEKENQKLSNYTNLLSLTDRYTKEFLDELSKIKKPITVVFYGDHLPGLYPDTAFIDNPESKYLTDYFIWSNDGNQKLSHPKINSSDLPALLLKHTNSKVSPYYALLTDVLENASVDKENLNKEQQEIANNLKMLQYDLVEGKGYITKHDDFFNLSK